jgi:hypothetical protein
VLLGPELSSGRNFLRILDRKDKFKMISGLYKSAAAVAIVLSLACAPPAASAQQSGANTAHSMPKSWRSYGREWPQVDCAHSHVYVPGQQVCGQGPLQGARGGGAGYISSRCTFEGWFAYAKSASSEAAVQVLMRQPGTEPACYVTEYADPDRALNAFGPVRKGVARSKLTDAGGLLVATFTSPLNESCAAFIKYGPRWRGGHLYNIRGVLCAAGGGPLSPADLQNFANAITVKTQ